MGMIDDEIIKMIEETRFVKVGQKSNLYTDMDFDSLSFIQLLIKIEERYSISFEIEQMDKCLRVDRLIAIVKSKLGEEYDKRLIEG